MTVPQFDCWQWLDAVLAPDSRLTSTERLVAIAVWRRWWNGAGADKFMSSVNSESRSKIIEKTALRSRTVARDLKSLERKGWLLPRPKGTHATAKIEYLPAMPNSALSALAPRALAPRALSQSARANGARNDARGASAIEHHVHTNSYVTPTNSSAIVTHEQREARALRQLMDRRGAIGIPDFRDPLPGESASDYRRAQNDESDERRRRRITHHDARSP